MGLIINYKRCPDCGNSLKKHYYECRSCGRGDITNWPITLIFMLAPLVILAIAYFFITNATGNYFAR